MATVRGYEPSDLEEDSGRAFDEHPPNVGTENVWVAEVCGEVVGLAGLT